MLQKQRKEEQAPEQENAATCVSISESPPEEELAGGYFQVGHSCCFETSIRQSR